MLKANLMHVKVALVEIMDFRDMEISEFRQEPRRECADTLRNLCHLEHERTDFPCRGAFYKMREFGLI